jgi:hypothetical protein
MHRMYTQGSSEWCVIVFRFETMLLRLALNSWALANLLLQLGMWDTNDTSPPLHMQTPCLALIIHICSY